MAGDAASSQTVQFAADHTKYVPSCEQHPITDGGGLSSTADWRCPQVKEDLLKPLRKRLEARVVELGLVPRLVKRISGSEKVCVCLGLGVRESYCSAPFTPQSVALIANALLQLSSNVGHCLCGSMLVYRETIYLFLNLNI